MAFENRAFDLHQSLSNYADSSNYDDEGVYSIPLTVSQDEESEGEV